MLSPRRWVNDGPRPGPLLSIASCTPTRPLESQPWVSRCVRWCMPQRGPTSARQQPGAGRLLHGTALLGPGPGVGAALCCATLGHPRLALDLTALHFCCRRTSTSEGGAQAGCWFAPVATLKRAHVLGACWSGSRVHGRKAKVALRGRARVPVHWRLPQPCPLHCALLQGR